MGPIILFSITLNNLSFPRDQRFYNSINLNVYSGASSQYFSDRDFLVSLKSLFSSFFWHFLAILAFLFSCLMNLNLMCLLPYLLVFLFGAYLIYSLTYISNIPSMFRELTSLIQRINLILAHVFSIRVIPLPRG